MRHGPIGYAIYFHCLELIAGDITETHITFELEHDSEIIADDLKIQGTKDMSAIDVVNMVMRDIVDLGLFESSESRIFCFKMLKRINTSMVSNVVFRKAIKKAKKSHDIVMTESCNTILDYTKLEDTRINKTTRKKGEYSDSFITFWNEYPRKANKGVASGAYNTVIASGITHEDIMSRIAVYKSQIVARNIEEQYIKHPSTFLNNIEDWKDVKADIPKTGGSVYNPYKPKAMLVPTDE
jgi:hypothetical protein